MFFGIDFRNCATRKWVKMAGKDGKAKDVKSTRLEQYAFVNKKDNLADDGAKAASSKHGNNDDISDLKSMMIGLQSSMSALDSNISGVRGDISAVKSDISSIHNEIFACKNLAVEAKSDALKTSTENDALKLENNGLRKRVSLLEERMLTLENDSRRNNVVFLGVPEDKDENVELKVRDVMKNKLSIAGSDSVILENAFRTKGGIKGQRPIIVKFNSERAKRLLVETAKSKFGDDSRIKVKNDIVKEWRIARQKLSPLFEKAKAENRAVKIIRDYLRVIVPNGQDLIYKYDPVTDAVFEDTVMDE